MRARSQVLLLTLLVCSPVSARADEVASFVGSGAAGLPALARVNVAAPRRPLQITAAASGGYGYTEAQQGESGAHHRGFGTLGVGVQPLRFLSGSLALEGRFDKHPNDVLGSSSTAVGEPRLAARVAEAIGPSVALGAQLGLRVPGAEAPSVRFDACSFDAHALATIAPAPDLAIALDVGYRLDRSSELVSNVARVRPGDRISLHASEFDALLLGAGASKRVGRVEILGEVSWEPLLGGRAPSALASPLRVGAGTRVQVSEPGLMPEGIQAELRTEIGLSRRPGNLPADPLAPIEPRVAFVLGFRFTRAPARPPASTTEPPPAVAKAPPSTPRAPVVATGTVRGKITGDKGEPIANAAVSAGGKTVSTAPDGSFTLELPAGKASLTVKATGYEDSVMEVEVVAGAAAAASVTAKHTIKPGQLRGLVRAFSGKPLAATIRVEAVPAGSMAPIETKTDADGVFQVDVPPGAYEVVVDADGFAGQRRKMQVEENGVTILNADLRPGK